MFPSILRFVVSVGLVAALIWFCADRADELFYHFKSPTPVDVGNVTGSDEVLQVGVNSYVAASGILGNKAASIRGLVPGSLRVGPLHVRHMLGSAVFVAYPEEQAADFIALSKKNVRGRLVDFGSSKNYEKVRAFLQRRLGMAIPKNARLIVTDEIPWHMWRYPLFFALCFMVAGMSFWRSLRALRPKTAKADDE